MTNRQIDEEAIFHIARDLTDTAKRSEYLQQACGRDQELRERIQGLLNAHEKEQAFLKSNVELETTAAKAPTAAAKSGSIAKPGEEIGRFKLLQQIGEGGFGVVFMAEQHKPIRRKVALKVIKPGMDTKGVVARFDPSMLVYTENHIAENHIAARDGRRNDTCLANVVWCIDEKMI